MPVAPTMRAPLAYLAFIALVSTGAQASHWKPCEAPEPVGWCSPVDREVVEVCGFSSPREGVSPTERDVLAVGSANGAYLRGEDAGVAYVPLGAAGVPPGGTAEGVAVYLESNGRAGLQTRAFVCGLFQWWAEISAWMGPFEVHRYAADAPVG